MLSEKQAVASLLDFQDQRRQPGLSRSTIRDLRRFESSGEINRWDRQISYNDLIKRISINDFQLTHPPNRQLASSVHQLPRRGISAGYRTPPPQLFRNMRPKGTFKDPKTFTFSLQKSVKFDKVFDDPKPLLSRRTRQSIVFPISMPSQQLTRQTPSDPSEHSKSKAYLKKQSEYRALLRRIQLRPSTQRNYEREKSLEMYKKNSVVIPTTFIPHCFRNVRLVRESGLRIGKY